MSQPITPNELKRFFPGASASTARRNDHDHAAQLSAGAKPEPNAGEPLVGKARGVKACGPGLVTGARYHIHCAVYSVRPRDWDNLAASIKEVQDQIVRAGWLPDDGWRVLTGSVESRKAYARVTERTVVTITREA